MPTSVQASAPPWKPGSATAIGSMPGTDPAEASRIVLGELPDLPHLPELPDRGPGATMIGRGCAVLADLVADLQPAGWRLTGASGSGGPSRAGGSGGSTGASLDQRYARSLLEQDLDAFTAARGSGGPDAPVKLQVAGPLTLAAFVERPRGGAVLADRSARRDLAQSLAEGVRVLLGELRSRMPGVSPVLQIDEPALPAVLGGTIPSPSGFATYPAIEENEAEELLGAVLTADPDAYAVAHCCATDPPVALLTGAGAKGVMYDWSLVRGPGTQDRFAAAADAGVTLFVGAVPARRPARSEPPVPAAGELADRLLDWWHSLGFEPEQAAARVVVTPACGMAGADPAWMREALRLAHTTGANLAGL